MQRDYISLSAEICFERQEISFPRDVSNCMAIICGPSKIGLIIVL